MNHVHHVIPSKWKCLSMYKCRHLFNPYVYMCSSMFSAPCVCVWIFTPHVFLCAYFHLTSCVPLYSYSPMCGSLLSTMFGAGLMMVATSLIPPSEMYIQRMLRQRHRVKQQWLIRHKIKFCEERDRKQLNAVSLYSILCVRHIPVQVLHTLL